MNDLLTIQLKLPRNTDVTPEAAQTFLSALTNINTTPSFEKLIFRKKAKPLALEISLYDHIIRFQLTAHKDLMPFIKTQLQSSYPLLIMDKSDDVLQKFLPEVASLRLTSGNYYPITTYESFKDVDPLSAMLSVLSKADENEMVLVQYALESTNANWHSKGLQYAEKGEKKIDGTYGPRSDQSIIKEKISYPGFKISIRIAASTNKTRKELIDSYGVFARSGANQFSVIFPNRFNKKTLMNNLINRIVAGDQILNTKELATLWHLPGEKIKTPSIAWGKAVLSEPPENLPTAEGKTEEEKRGINFFARTLFHNQETVFGIREKDRWRHVWTVGKTGTGKSTMIANMAIDDLKKGRGIGVIDPHGDLAETILDYIPSNRINDTIYFNPADREFPVSINPLEVKNREDAELVVSGLMSI